MYEHKRKIALALLLVVLTIYAGLYVIQSSTINNAFQKTATVSKDMFWGAKQILIMGEGSDRKSGVIDVPILIPTTTNNVKSPSLKTLPLTTESIPSIIATAESNFNYKVYVGTEQYELLATQLMLKL